jgi:hypothetical protein
LQRGRREKTARNGRAPDVVESHARPLLPDRKSVTRAACRYAGR